MYEAINSVHRNGKAPLTLEQYVARKFDILAELYISPTKEQIAALKHSRSEIHADNIMRDIVCPPLADMRIH